MAEDVAIKVSGVSKDFVLPHEKSSSVKGLVINLVKRNISGKEVQHAVRDISFEIKKGEFFGIVGRNGSGKSTMLKMLAGIYQPNKGKIEVQGKLVPFIELGVGFNPELTGRENVYLNGAMMGFAEKEVNAIYEEIVEFAELERFMDQKLKNYSSGMQVRLAFSMAIRAEADVLLIDEVLAVGDADFQRKCFSYFRQLKKDKKTVVFVSHDMNAVREYCDRALMIDKSRVVFSGSADETAKEYTRLFLPNELANQKKHIVGQRNSKKWGAGGVEIIDVSLSKPHYDKADKAIEITFTVKSTDGFEDEIIPGVTLKSESGEPVCGTNSRIIQPEKRYYIGGSAKTKITTKWTIPNIFNAGNFIVEPAVLSGTTNETLQWWDDAERFEVINDESTPYPAAPQIKMTQVD